MNKKEEFEKFVEGKVEELNELKKQMNEKIQQELSSIISDLMQDSEVIESVGWTQFTPYFNDGAPCVFSAYIDEPKINGTNVYDLPEEDKRFEKTFYKDLETEEQVKVNKRLARETDAGDWYQRKTIGDYGLHPNPDYDEKEEEIYDSICGLLRAIPEETLETVFGDHCEVTITQEGKTIIDSYEDHH